MINIDVFQLKYCDQFESLSDRWQPCAAIILVEHNRSYGNYQTMVFSNTCYAVYSTVTHAAVCSPWKQNLWSEMSCKERTGPIMTTALVPVAQVESQDHGVIQVGRDLSRSPPKANSNICFSYHRILAEERDRIWYALMQLLNRELVMSTPKLLYLGRTCRIYSWITSIIPLQEEMEVLPLLVLSGSLLN